MVALLNCHSARRLSRPSIKSVHELVCVLSSGRLLTKTYCRRGPVFAVGEDVVEPRVVNEVLATGQLEPLDCRLFADACPRPGA